MMRALIVTIATLHCAVWSVWAWAQATPVRMLPAFSVSSSTGAAISTNDLHLSKQWVLVVIDPALPSAKELLRTLVAKETLWSERVTILLLRESAAVRDVIAAEPKLANVRVVVANTADAIAQLDIPGVPAVLGIRANDEIAWVRAGLISRPGRMHELLSGWLSAAAAE